MLLFVLPLLALFKKPINWSWLKQNALRIAAFLLIILLTLPYINLLAIKFGQVNIFSFARESFNLVGFSLKDKLSQPFTIFTMTFWGDFGWADVPLAYQWFGRLNKIWLLPVIGLLVVFWQVASKEVSFNRSQIAALIFLFLTLLLVLFVTLVFQPVWVKTLNWMPQARYAWVILIPLAFFFAFGTVFPFKNKIVPFLILSLAATVYEAAVLFKVIIPHYYSSLFSFSGVKPAEFYSPSLYQQLVELGIVTPNQQQKLLLRPDFLNSSLFYFGLFLLIYGSLIFFFYQAVKADQQAEL